MTFPSGLIDSLRTVKPLLTIRSWCASFRHPLPRRPSDDFLGVVLRFKNEADAANAPPIVLPAADIREVAKQAN